MTLLIGLCALVVCVVCVVLVFHQHYEDGLFGRIALGLICIASFARATSILNTSWVEVSNIGSITWIGLAMFMARHAYRFLRRCKHKDKDNTWYDVDTTIILKRPFNQ